MKEGYFIPQTVQASRWGPELPVWAWPLWAATGEKQREREREKLSTFFENPAIKHHSHYRFHSMEQYFISKPTTLRFLMSRHFGKQHFVRLLLVGWNRGGENFKS